ncbi:hypothetical protein AUCHE_05_04490 [Austwickia chelonae NBRC 105200]|uniref:Uncharacterized protein n=1 Tax=Austwickia chelonae NBRC 105200 TaxID=1184607 RepID=K6W6U1_9MICO|nr:hypothetical protein AUCHE_05_04490 [Austwickia chelonae NBRC 105200]
MQPIARVVARYKCYSQGEFAIKFSIASVIAVTLTFGLTGGSAHASENSYQPAGEVRILAPTRRYRIQKISQSFQQSPLRRFSQWKLLNWKIFKKLQDGGEFDRAG